MEKSTSNVADRVTSVLKCSSYGPLRALEVIEEGDAVVLKGQLPNCFLLQMAHALASGVDGVGIVRCQIRVVG